MHVFADIVSAMSGFVGGAVCGGVVVMVVTPVHDFVAHILSYLHVGPHA